MSVLTPISTGLGKRLQGPWSSWRRTWVLLALCLLLYLPGITKLPVTDRDEARYVQATRQMVDSGNWVDIRFQNESRYKKPVGIYWLQAISASAARSLGVDATERAPYRLPSALGATAAVLLTYRGFRSLLGESGAFRAALMLAPSLLISVEAHLAKTDGVLLASVVAMQAGMAQLYCRGQEGAHRTHRLLFWGGLGVGVLIKGPVALAIALFTLMWLCIKEKSLMPLGMLKPWPWLILPLLIVGPWLWSIQGMSSGEFLHDSLGKDFLAKLIEGQESHGAPPGTYLLITPFLLFPVSWVLLPKAWQGVRQKKTLTTARIQTFALAWLIPAWIAFELVPTKLFHYVLPLIPALCLLGALGADRSNTPGDTPQWLIRITGGIWISSGVVLALAVPATAFWLKGFIPWSAMAVSLIAIGFLVGAPRLFGTDQRLAASATTGVLIFGLLYGAVVPGLTPLWPAQSLRMALTKHQLLNLPIILNGYQEPSAVFNLGTNLQMGDFQAVADQLSRKIPTVAIVPTNTSASLTTKLAKQGIKLHSVERVKGVNYSNGRPLDLTILVNESNVQNSIPSTNPRAPLHTK